jgi:hypothetical protein
MNYFLEEIRVSGDVDMQAAGEGGGVPAHTARERDPRRSP